MKTIMSTFSCFLFAFLLAFEVITATTLIPVGPVPIPIIPGLYPANYCGPIIANDKDRLQFALNYEFGEAEFICNAVLGHGLDVLAPKLTQGGPPPIGAMKANLDPLTKRIFEEFCYQTIGHIRAISQTVGGIPRPHLNISKAVFAEFFDLAVGYKLNPPFNPYANKVNFLLASYLAISLDYVEYVGINSELIFYKNKQLAAGLLGVQAGRYGVIRTLLYEIADQKVKPYKFTVAYIISAIANLRNAVAKCGIKEEGLIVPKSLGAEMKTTSNILSADANSLSYARTPQEFLRIVYATGKESKAGGFFPQGLNGKIAREFLALGN